MAVKDDVQDGANPSTADFIGQEENVEVSKPSKGRQILASIISGLASGNCLGWSSPTQPQIQFSSLSPNEGQNYTWEIRITPDQMSWAGSVMNVGALIGAIAAGLSVGPLGRKFSLIFLALPFTVGWLLIALSITPAMLYMGRITAGIGHGFCLATVPSYLSEISSPNFRGTTGFMFTFSLYFGTLTMSAFGLTLYWRFFSILPLLPLTLLVTGMIYVPESPILLLKKNNREGALNSLRKLRGPNYNCEQELRDMEEFVHRNSASSVNFRDIFLPHVYRPMLIGMSLMVFQQFAGVNVIGFYSAEIFRLAGSSINPLQCSLIINSVGIVSISLIGTIVADRLPRRLILVACETLSCLALACLGLYFHLIETPIVSNLRWLPLVCLMTSTLSVACGLGAIPWIVASEILPVQFRGPGSSVVAFTNRLMSFIVTKTFFDLQTGLTIAGAFWFYSGCCCLGAVSTLFFMPETRGKSQIEIQKCFIKS